MSDTYEVENNGIDGEDQMGSWYHSCTQTKLASLLDQKESFFVVTELSLDISQHDLSQYRLEASAELKPDVCVYLKRPIIPENETDLVTVSQMPDLAIEVLSPKQSVSYLNRKIKAYFELGVRSCWLVNPEQGFISVYSTPNRGKPFSYKEVEVIDEVMDIRLPIQKVFYWFFEDIPGRNYMYGEPI